MIRFTIAAIVLFAITATPLHAQEIISVTASAVHDEVAEASTSFHRQVILTGRQMVRDNELKRTDMIALRVAMISPAFRGHAEDLAVVQMTFSGAESEHVPVGADGQIDKANINWPELTAFIKVFIPLLLELLKAFAAI